MKKKIGLLIIFILIIFSAIGFIYFKLNQSDETNEKKTDICEIDGVLIDGTMNSISVKTSKGTIYLFATEDVDMSRVDGLIIGKKLHIKYKGKLDKNIDFQTGKIIDIYSDSINNDIEETKESNNNYPVAWDDKGIFSKYYKKAYEKLLTLSKDEKVGQLILARVPETNEVGDVSTYHLGGYILFGKDTKNKTFDELKNTIASYQDASSVPMLIATDEEGGTVVRVSSNTNLSANRFKSSQELYNEGGFNLIKEDTITKSNLLNSLGINTNLAPVADVSTNSDDYMYDRSFGKDGEETAKYVKTVINASKNTNVSYVLKHFPGYGNNVNTHTGIAIDERSIDSFKENDFLPFEAGIESGAEAVLVSHNIVNSMDNTTPASLSINVHNILREDLNFTGIIMTDDLAMDAIKDYVTNPVIKAITSGNDLLIVSDYQAAINDINNAINDGTITEELIDQLAFKVLAWKYYKGLIK